MYTLLAHLCPGFSGGSNNKESACNAGDLGSIPGSGRSPGEGNGNPLWYSCLKISWTENPGVLQFTESKRVGHDWMTFFFLLCAHLYPVATEHFYKEYFMRFEHLCKH